MQYVISEQHLGTMRVKWKRETDRMFLFYLYINNIQQNADAVQKVYN